MLTNATKTLVFIDSTLAEVEILVEGVLRGTKAIILQKDVDAVRQITETLADNTQVESIHLVSHGAPGCLYLGRGQLNLDNIEEYAPQLRRWRRAFVPSIFLYGCNVARGLRGRGFIDKLRQLTGAKVAASVTRTGNKELGGNWEF